MDKDSLEYKERQRQYGIEGGKKLAAERGPEYYSELGRKGRASQLANQTPRDPSTPKPASGKRSRSARQPLAVTEQPDDPLLNL